MSRRSHATPGNSRVDNAGSGSSIQIHRQVAMSSLLRILKTPASSLMTTVVIAVSLLLPALLFGLNSNLTSVLNGFQNNARISLYLEENVSENEGIEVSDRLLTWAEIVSTEYISSTQALRDFSAAAGLSDLSQELATNPLPAAIIVTPGNVDPEAVEALTQRLQGLSEVALVQVDNLWLQRLAAISELVGLIGKILTAIVVLGLFFIVGNTIKLAIENRKDEIRVIKLVGGTDMFIARPFLYIGLFYGVGGGILACILQFIVLTIFNSSFRQLMQLYESSFELQGFGIANSFLLITIGVVISWTAALLASLRHIRAINP